MVLPLAMMVAGYGLQAYGSDQRTQAIRRNLDAQRVTQQLFAGLDAKDAKQFEEALRLISGAHDQSVDQLVADNDPNKQLAAYSAGNAQSQSKLTSAIDQLAGMTTGGPAGGNAGFALAQQQAGAQTAARTGTQLDAASMAGGLDLLGLTQRQAAGAYSTRSKGLTRRALDLRRLYELGGAHRRKALEQLNQGHAADMLSAQQEGNGLMLLGGLLGSGGQAYGSYQANQQPGLASLLGGPQQTYHTNTGGYGS